MWNKWSANESSIIASRKKILFLNLGFLKLNFRLYQMWKKKWKKEIYPKACCDFYLPGTTGIHLTLSCHLVSLLTLCSPRHKSLEWRACAKASFTQGRNIREWAPAGNLDSFFNSTTAFSILQSFLTDTLAEAKGTKVTNTQPEAPKYLEFLMTK